MFTQTDQAGSDVADEPSAEVPAEESSPNSDESQSVSSSTGPVDKAEDVASTEEEVSSVEETQEQSEPEVNTRLQQPSDSVIDMVLACGT